jgi:hypothetical protein
MPMPSPQQQGRARIFGMLFALTFVTSIAGLLLYDTRVQQGRRQQPDAVWVAGTDFGSRGTGRVGGSAQAAGPANSCARPLRGCVALEHRQDVR